MEEEWTRNMWKMGLTPQNVWRRLSFRIRSFAGTSPKNGARSVSPFRESKNISQGSVPSPLGTFFRKKMHFKFFLEQKMVCRTLRNAFFTLTESENGYTSIPIYLMGLKMADRALSARSLDANSLWGKMSERKCQGGESSPKIPHNQFQSVC